MPNWFWIVFGVVIILSYIGTKLSMNLANRLNIVDDPNSAPERKSQSKPIPLIGASGLILVATTGMSLVWLVNKYNWFELREYLGQNLFFPFALIWIVAGIGLLTLAGLLDDWRIGGYRIYIPLVFLALLLTVTLGGLKIEAFSYPFNELNLRIAFLPQLLAFVWIGLCIAATKFLDGHDGLVASVGIVALLTIVSVATLANVNQPLIQLFGLIWAGALIGFLPLNFPNAKIYLGDAGSTVVGFTIGVMSILSGAKVATASTVIGWFILDIVVVMSIRLWRTKSIKGLLIGDSKLHWHHRLRNLGLSKVQVLVFTVIVILITSQVGLLVQTSNKVWALIVQSLILIFAFAFSLKKN